MSDSDGLLNRPIFFALLVSSPMHLRKRFAEFLVALFEKVVRVFLEELQIELEQAVATAELVRIRNRKSRNELRHVHQRLAGDDEHIVTSRDHQQRGLVLRECLAALVGGGIEIDECHRRRAQGWRSSVRFGFLRRTDQM